MMVDPDRSKTLIRSLRDRHAAHPTGAPAAPRLACGFDAATSDDSVVWPVPVFSRLALDCDATPAVLAALEAARHQSGYSVVDRSQATATAASEMADDPSAVTSSGHRVVAVYADAPIVPEATAHASFIEWQFLPSPQPRSSSSNPEPWGARKADWSPTLPSDLSRLDQFAARIELMRQWSTVSQVRVGGAIPAAAVYDDVRLMADLGLDYVSLLCDVRYGMGAGQVHRLMDVQRAVDLARQALHDAGRPELPLLISCDACPPQEAVRWLAMGVRAINLDGYLIAHQTVPEARPSDSFGSFLGDYGRTVAANSDWLGPAVASYVAGLASELAFAGYDSLQTWMASGKKASQPSSAERTPSPRGRKGG